MLNWQMHNRKISSIKKKDESDFPNLTTTIKETIKEIDPSKQNTHIIELKQNLPKQKRQQIYRHKTLIHIVVESTTKKTKQPREDKIILLQKLCNELEINISLAKIVEWWKKKKLPLPPRQIQTINLTNRMDKDPKVPIQIFNCVITKTIVDGGSNVNVLPQSTWIHLKEPEYIPPNYSIHLADKS